MDGRSCADRVMPDRRGEARTQRWPGPGVSPGPGHLDGAWSGTYWFWLSPW
jgi:hypothetical protein